MSGSNTIVISGFLPCDIETKNNIDGNFKILKVASNIYKSEKFYTYTVFLRDDKVISNNMLEYLKKGTRVILTGSIIDISTFKTTKEFINITLKLYNLSFLPLNKSENNNQNLKDINSGELENVLKDINIEKSEF